MSRVTVRKPTDIAEAVLFDGVSELPRKEVNFSVPSFGTTVTVRSSGGDHTTLQAAWDAVDRSAGSVGIEVEAGYDPGPLTAGAQVGDDENHVVAYVEGIFDVVATLPRHLRVTSADKAKMAQVVAPVSGGSWSSAVTFEADAKRVRIIGFSFEPPEDDSSASLIACNDSGSTFPSGIILDRCLARGHGASYNVRRGLFCKAMGLGFGIIDCDFDEFNDMNSDSQAVLGGVGPGPYTFVNTLFGAAGENIMFGGFCADNVEEIAADITISRCILRKRLDWGKRETCSATAVDDTISSTAHGFVDDDAVKVKSGDGSLPGNLSAATRYWVINATADAFQLSATKGGAAIDLTSDGTNFEVWRSFNVKNLFELKMAKRCLLEDFILQGHWADAQSGACVVIKSVNQSGACSFEGNVTDDTILRWGRVSDSPGGLSLSGVTEPVAAGTHRLRIHNLLLYGIADAATYPDGVDDLLGLFGNEKKEGWEVDHVTLISENTTGGTLAQHSGGILTDLTFKDSIVSRGGLGWRGDGSAEGDDTFAAWVTGDLDWDYVTLIGKVGDGVSWLDNYSGTAPNRQAIEGVDNVGFEDPANDDYRLAAGHSVDPASDGGERGCDVATLNDRLQNVAAGDFRNDQWSS